MTDAVAPGSDNGGGGDTTPAPGTPEYDAAMIAKFEGQGHVKGENNDGSIEPTQEIPPMPEYGLEKFYNKETGEYDHANHVKDANYRLEQATKAPNAPKGDDAPADGDTTTVTPIQWSDYETAMGTEEGLSADQVAALEAVGIPGAVVEDYMAMAAEVKVARTNTALAHVGGEENWQAIGQWAKANLSEGEYGEYNNQLAGPGWKMAMDSLMSRSGIGGAPARGEPNLVGGRPQGGQGTTVTQGYASKAEMTKDMADPQYKTDPAFRRQVAQRVERSTFH